MMVFEGEIYFFLINLSCIEDSYLVGATDTMEGQVKDWLNSHISENDHVFVHDATNQYAQVCFRMP